jgi:hypothetical protein
MFINPRLGLPQLHFGSQIANRREIVVRTTFLQYQMVGILVSLIHIFISLISDSDFVLAPKP